MIGTIVNAGAILLGGTVGLTVAKELSVANQSRLKLAMGLFVIYVGFSMTWKGLNGSFFQVGKQLLIIMAALIIGNILGKLLRIQANLNKLGEYAKERFSKAQPTDQNRVSDGFVTCSLLFCIGPMAILGALEDGLSGTYRTLLVKSVMDGLSTVAFAKTFGWGVMLSAIPVLAYQGTITLGARFVAPYVKDQAVLDSIGATGGLLVLCTALIILGLKKVPLADYLPSLAIAPLLTWLFK